MLPLMPLAVPDRVARSHARARAADRGGIVVFGVVSGLASATLVVLATILQIL